MGIDKISIEVECEEPKTVEELGYAAVERANQILAESGSKEGWELRTIGRQLIEGGRNMKTEEIEKLDEDIEDTSDFLGESLMKGGQ